MENVLATLTHEHIVLDLGCGSGSFHYGLYKCQVIGIDLTISETIKPSQIRLVQANSAAIPLASGSVDVVVCHHTLEHFDDFQSTLIEIDRVLNDDGVIWIAIPDGHSWDDELYRFVFSGGGHVNRFSRDQLTEAVQRLTRFRLVQEVDLFSSFIYLKKPTREAYEHYPRTARFLYHVPDGASIAAILGINAVTRIIDKLFGSRLSQYGWGFVFASKNTVLPPLNRPYFNVCSACGSGISAKQLLSSAQVRRLFGIGIFHCPYCRRINAFVVPPEGCE